MEVVPSILWKRSRGDLEGTEECRTEVPAGEVAEELPNHGYVA